MKKKLFSGIQPSGIIHIGNILGAINQWKELQDSNNSIFCIVDLHAITIYQDPKKLKKNIINTAKILIASGINPKKSTLFIQSEVSEHLELYWALNSVARISELQLMTQYKDKALKHSSESISAGLLNYPVLMSSDILLYDTEIVPVGEDQVQHVELARELARRFNSLYGNTFEIPKAKINKNGARIMGLDNPKNKMSKSASSEKNYIAITDDEKTILKKIKSAQTDSGSEIKYDINNKPGISNLLSIESAISEENIDKLEKKYKGIKYGEFKNEVANKVAEYLKPIQKSYNSLSDREVMRYYEKGAKKAKKIASKKIAEVYKKIGIRF